MSEVTDMLASYRNGDMTLDELAQRFRDRVWPSRRPSPRDVHELFQRDIEDPEPIQEGSFEEVASACTLGQISLDEYEVLARAVSEASGPPAS